jgi:sugar/nucleoside kinase (ribokinase family)
MFCDILARELPNYDVVIVVDFGHGMFSPEAIDLLCNKARFLAVNAQSNAGNVGYQTIHKYHRADYISMAENEIRMETRDRRGDLRKMVIEIANKFNCERVTVTRGRNGCLCYSRTDGFVEVPAFAGKVLDRMGAGDAFLSLTALCVAQKVPLETVGFIGNAVGAQAVATVGHRSSIERASLYKHIEALLK